VSGSGDMTVCVWDIASGLCIDALAASRATDCPPHSHWIWGVDLFNDYIFSSSQDSSIKCWDRKTGACLKTLREGEDGHTATVYSVHMRDGFLVTGSKDRLVKVWDMSAVV